MSIRRFLPILILALLAACSAPATPSQGQTPVPPTFTPLAAKSQQLESTLDPWTEVPATSTTASPTITSPVTSSVGQGDIRFDSIELFESSNGWAGTSSGENPTDINHGVWRTTDGGRIWNQVLPTANDVSLLEAVSGLSAWVAECQPADQGCRYVLFRTRDGGQTWQELGADLPVVVALLEFFNEQDGVHTTYDVAAGSTFLRFQETHDGGLSWKPIEFQSSHQGEPASSWGYHLCGICGDVYYLGIDRFIVVGGNLSNEAAGRVTLWLTQDQGTTWRDQELHAPAGTYEQAWVEPYSPRFINGIHGVLPLKLTSQDFNQRAVAFYGTMDGGMSWQYRSLIELPEEANRRITVQMPTASDLFFVCGSKLCTSQDGGSTWRKLTTPFAWAPNPDQPYVEAYGFTNATKGWALVGQDESTLWMSEDGGITWEQIDPQFLPSP